MLLVNILLTLMLSVLTLLLTTADKISSKTVFSVNTHSNRVNNVSHFDDVTITVSINTE